MRKAPTEAERRLWSALRSHRLAGWKCAKAGHGLRDPLHRTPAFSTPASGQLFFARTV
ncbi:hypothetical protein [Altererythrobacter sp. H2]|uniref:hypothetical protein n=1 Tax=Altererythrobacter sp. H2 TaxID=3108391 RepID=UPI003A5CD810